jgi:ABC-type multidrug transport system fused ATPase/permease subunit
MAGAERVFEILDAQSDVKDDGKLELKDCKGVVEFKDVAFNYLPDVPVLRDINFKIDSGKMLAIVGVTGAGKTTIISTLARFYDIEKGEILIDGQNIKDVSLKSLRDNISAVLQDVFLFNGTVFENIAYAMPNSSQEEVEKAAMGARIHDDILAMPEGYGTVIGERGVRLSGGQKQRLSIARAILRNSPILILDEATASVDVETEHFIQQSIADLAGTRTIIVIAHRLSTIKKADEIIVIGGGTIQERGTHEQLIKRNGIYANLANVQISGAEDDGK